MLRVGTLIVLGALFLFGCDSKVHSTKKDSDWRLNIFGSAQNSRAIVKVDLISGKEAVVLSQENVIKVSKLLKTEPEYVEVYSANDQRIILGDKTGMFVIVSLRDQPKFEMLKFPKAVRPDNFRRPHSISQTGDQVIWLEGSATAKNILKYYSSKSNKVTTLSDSFSSATLFLGKWTHDEKKLFFSERMNRANLPQNVLSRGDAQEPGERNVRVLVEYDVISGRRTPIGIVRESYLISPDGSEIAFIDREADKVSGRYLDLKLGIFFNWVIEEGSEVFLAKEGTLAATSYTNSDRVKMTFYQVKGRGLVKMQENVYVSSDSYFLSCTEGWSISKGKPSE